MDNQILLVDDEPGLRKVMEITLADMGYDVQTAASGEAALDHFDRCQPSIVLTDIKMPGMDGIALLRRIKAQNPDTEVIMITGHGDIDLAIKSLKYEATDFVTKPINDDVLEIALNRARDRISMRRQLRDYTENLEQLVREKTAKLLEAERMAAVGQTVAGLSHAIKNIASGLKGGTFVVEKGLELDDREYLLDGWQMVKSNVARIKNLSLDMLDFAKSPEVLYQNCHPNQPAREVIELMQARFAEHGIDLEVDLASDLDEFRFDPDGIHRCLLNMVTNALDACLEHSCEQAPARVRIQSRRHLEWAVAYRVSDTCGGMHQDVRERIFNSFFSTKGSKGTGIGLMLTQRIVAAHGGVIEVDSRPGHGSTFRIYLPWGPESETETTQHETTQPATDR